MQGLMQGGKSMLVGACLLATAAAAEPPIEFSGVLVENGRPKIALTDKTTHTTRWVDPGAVFNGYTVANYRANEEAVVLRKDGQEYRLLMVASKTPPESPAAASVIALRTATAPLPQPPAPNPGAPAPAPAAAVLAPEPPAAGVLARELPAGGAAAAALPTTNASPTGNAAPTANPSPTGNAPTGNATITRAVEPGETLETIAGKSGLTLDQLKTLNPTANEGSLRPGQVIRIR